ncbi:uncharacterized protein PV09_05851 [Verruconis gallopava]|uniref:Uncharacterized protein n=1 Tax=Verruconis gallopava TaxID=253628 RepID=A0A0D2A872_9PEZI|nr:uncharacterized protein PV09_05851 [Verruconis gallopava]KIW02790.1 hypothetical protein PV09_05851 [Verruconis gallopava]
MSDSIASYILKPTALKALYCGNMATRGIMTYIMAYLGYINVGYAALAGLRAHRLGASRAATTTREMDLLALTVLAVANGSQAWGSFMRSRGSGRWIMGHGLDRITVLDTVFMVLDALAALAYSWKQ